MKELFRSESKIDKHVLQNIPNHVVERRTIVDFLSGLPIEKLKELVGFECINFEDKNIWGDSREYRELYDLLCRLRAENVVLYKCKIRI